MWRSSAVLAAVRLEEGLAHEHACDEVVDLSHAEHERQRRPHDERRRGQGRGQKAASDATQRPCYGMARDGQRMSIQHHAAGHPP